MNKPVWNVIAVRNNKVVNWNVFDHWNFYEDFQKWLKDTDNIDDFEYEMERETRYYFWSRCEYEIVVRDMFDQAEKKVDIYSQLRANWDRFISYLWSFKI